jgi:hypothetical protein
LLASAVASGGTVVAAIEIAAISTEAGGSSGGAYTAAVLGLVSVFTAISTPFVTGWIHRWGCSELLRNSLFLHTVIFVPIGVAATSSSSAYALILVMTPLSGVLMAIRMTCTPLFARVALTRDSPAMWARRQLFRGPACAVGAIIGGFFVSDSLQGLGLVLGGLTTLPLAVVAASTQIPTNTESRRRREFALGWDLLTMWRDPSTRVGLGVAAVGAIVLAPLHAMIVPVVSQLDQVDLLQGAGLILAALQIGSMGTTAVLPRMRAHPSVTNNRLAPAALAMAGALLILLAMSAAWLVGRPELVAWVLIAGLIGLARGVVSAAQLGEFMEDTAGLSDADGMALLNFVRTALTPVGLLLWGFTVDAVGAEVLLTAAGLVTVGVASLLARPRRQA